MFSNHSIVFDDAFFHESCKNAEKIEGNRIFFSLLIKQLTIGPEKILDSEKKLKIKPKINFEHGHKRVLVIRYANILISTGKCAPFFRFHK